MDIEKLRKNLIEPFRLCENIFFAGIVKASTHLIDTGDGLIVIDSGYQETLDIVLGNIRKLGFAPEDIRYILHSHGHIDHAGATAALVELTGAKTVLGKADLGMVTGENLLSAASELNLSFRHFTPDILLEDGDILKLGNTEIKCISTPGHTPGTFSFFWNTQTQHGTLTSAMMGGLGLNTLRSDYIRKHDLAGENWRADFARSLELMKSKKVDITVGNHCNQNMTVEKSELLKKGFHDAFIDPQMWQNMLNTATEQFKQLLENDPL